MSEPKQVSKKYIPTKTAVFSSAIFDDAFIKKASDMGYSTIEIQYPQPNSIPEMELGKIVETKDISQFLPEQTHLLKIASPEMASKLKKVDSESSTSFIIELELNRSWNKENLLNFYKQYSQHRIYINCPIDFNEENKELLKPNEVFILIKTLTRAGFAVNTRADKPADNVTIPTLRFYETGYEVLLSNDSPPTQFSFVIPVYNNKKFVLQTLHHLDILHKYSPCFDVVLCDDGSTDQLREDLTNHQPNYSFPFTFLHNKREKGREMGDYQYRAGLSRNIGVGHSKGKYLVFLDSDILVSKNFLKTLEKEIEVSDLIMCRRLHVNTDISAKLPTYDEIESDQLMEVDEGYWIEFHKKGYKWNSLNEKWKYVCTHSLCIRKSLFHNLGGIPNNYNIYGYEDVELGYKVAKKGGVFKLSDNVVYHLSPMEERSEYSHEHQKKLNLLNKSAKIFYYNSLAEDVFNHCNSIWNYNKSILNLKTYF